MMITNPSTKQQQDKHQVHDQVCKLFKLSSTNKLLDDVGCVYSKKMYQSEGRMYIFEKYICFYSKLLGQSKKIVIPLSTVTLMKKAKALGLIQNAIKFYLTDDKKYFFKRVKNRDQTFEMIYKLWEEASPHAKSKKQEKTLYHTVIEGNSEDDDDAEYQLTNTGEEEKTRSLSIDRPSTDIKLSFGNNLASELQVPNLIDKKVLIKSASASDIHVDLQKKLTDVQEQQIQEEQADKHNSDQIQQSEKKPAPTDDQLTKILANYSLYENHQEIGKTILPISVNEYFQLFIEKGGKCTPDYYFKERGDKNIQLMRDWSETIDEDLKSAWDKRAQKQKILYTEVQIKGNPFVKQSPTTKNYLLLEKNDCLINLRVYNQIKDVPYSEYFNLEENWLITSTESSSDKCIVRQSACVIFNKSTIMKSKIENNNISAATTNFQHWAAWALNKIKLYQRQKQKRIQALQQQKKLQQQQQKQENDAKSNNNDQQNGGNITPTFDKQSIDNNFEPQLLQQQLGFEQENEIEQMREQIDVLQNKVNDLESIIQSNNTQQQKKNMAIFAILTILTFLTVFLMKQVYSLNSALDQITSFSTFNNQV